jgi:peptide/nickel transport system permease protein
LAAHELAPPTPAGPGLPVAEGGEAAASSGSTQLNFSAFLHNRRAMIGAIIIVAIGLFCFGGPLLYHFSLKDNPLLQNNPPGAGNPLGTDQFGIDVLGRLMQGGQSSLELGFAVGLASTLIAMIYGAIAGMFGGVVDAVMMRIVDTLLAVPYFVLLIIVASMFTLSLPAIILILTALSWADISRLVRGQVLALRPRAFVDAATSMGSTRWRILVRHMLPNTLGVCVVTATFGVADSIYALSALSFLGIGPPPPFADWGTLLTDGVDNLFNGYWWQVYPPLIVLVIVVVAFRQLGDALNDIVSGNRTSGARRRVARKRSVIPLASRYE